MTVKLELEDEEAKAAASALADEVQLALFRGRAHEERCRRLRNLLARLEAEMDRDDGKPPKTTIVVVME